MNNNEIGRFLLAFNLCLLVSTLGGKVMQHFGAGTEAQGCLCWNLMVRTFILCVSNIPTTFLLYYY